ncbi:MAG: cellulase family glycosylhydrolase [Promethearchaeota archaeon]
MLKIEKNWFFDEFGRKILLRGVNLSGSAKMPRIPDGSTHIKTDFHDHREVSFVGRPFPLKDAKEHFSRIKHWGFNTIRFVVTWEAIEHANPKDYDKEYLSYFQDLLTIAGEEYKFHIIIDPHQDAWSRLSGGDGAPGWTFEKIGLDYTKFDASEGAIVMQYRFDSSQPKSYESMSWSNNLIRCVNGTMWTIFFGGEDFASSCKINTMNAQEYLQEHFIRAFRELARYIKDNPYLIGFSTLNEPGKGWIGQLVDGSDMDVSEIIGYAFTPFDSMLLAAGYSREIPLRAIKRLGIREIGRDYLNPKQVSCWTESSKDIWKEEGVWGLDDGNNPVILRNDYFKIKNGKEIEFNKEYLTPFVSKFTQGIREIIPDSYIFFGLPLDMIVKGERIDIDLPPMVFLEGHWYDVASIGMKRFMKKANFDIKTGKTVIGEGNVQNMFVQQMQAIKETAIKTFGQEMVLIGEIGLCFDLQNKKAYDIWHENPKKAWDTLISAFSTYYNALDANLLHSLHWNYTPDNNNKFGDLWNLEDFSIFSKDQKIDSSDINSGGRAIEGFCRPHIVRVAGNPQEMRFENKNKTFKLRFNANSSIKAPTIMYVPEIHYPNGFTIETSGKWERSPSNTQIVLLHAIADGSQTVIIKPK